MAPDVRKPPILRNAPLYLGALLTHRETFGLLANWLQGPLSFLCLLLPNVKDEPRLRPAGRLLRSRHDGRGRWLWRLVSPFHRRE